MYLQILHFLVTPYVDSFNNYYVVLYQAAQSNLAEYPNVTLTTDALFEKIIKEMSGTFFLDALGHYQRF